MSFSSTNTNNNYKILLFFISIFLIASIITFSLFIRNIYMNMDQIREQEMKFRDDIFRLSGCCSFYSTQLDGLLKARNIPNPDL